MIQKITEFVRNAAPQGIEVRVEVPELESHGHYATSVALRLAKELKQPPLEVANEIAERIRAADRGGFFAKVETAPPGFVNFWLSAKTLHDALRGIVGVGARWGGERRQKKTVVIDYSHPNIAKPMSVAHLRSTIIGQALYNIFKFRGWRTIGDNHLGDWGKQFGVLIAAWKELPEKPREVTIEELMGRYVSYTARMKENPMLEERARAETKKLQDGDRENIHIWKQFYRISLNEFKKIYALLHIQFDYCLGESSYRNMLQDVVSDALARGIAERSEGAVIIPIAGKPPFVIQKSDEAFLYSTTDLAAIIYRNKKFKPSLVLYVVDNGQSLHFEQLFAAARKLGYTRGEALAHVKFGLFLGEDLKKLSTRAGKHVKLDAVLEEAVSRARGVVEEKRKELAPEARERIAAAVGIGAVKYNDLSQNRQSDIAFKWEKMLNLEGNSAPYLMYAHARLRSILRRAGRTGAFDAGALVLPQELALIARLANFPYVLEEITQSYFPHHLADYLYALAQQANTFYHAEPVLKATPAVREARLGLVAAIAQTLATGLSLIGISAPEEM